MNHVMEANDLWMGVPLQSDDHFWGEIGSVQFYCMLSRVEQGRGWGQGRGAIFPPYFGRSVYSIPTRRGADYAKHINTRTLPHPHIF